MLTLLSGLLNFWSRLLLSDEAIARCTRRDSRIVALNIHRPG